MGSYDEYGVSFAVTDQELWKEHATVADLIRILKEFPPELRVNAFFECRLDEEENVVFLEDRRTTILLDIIMDCPFCKEYMEVKKDTREPLN